ncbi:hypothetical protein [Peribacillus deserti]|uniref:Uncharacterized protein n=1 Tax=Peribacillus deserti TaxID=673318 RepID=A0A2N5M0F6_9BACI|nr:hypothetical protein [Peribacillus deserti]PLT27842.1 hypothetical protein CUU66_21615 [Peribacillus deserti]
MPNRKISSAAFGAISATLHFHSIPVEATVHQKSAEYQEKITSMMVKTDKEINALEKSKEIVTKHAAALTEAISGTTSGNKASNRNR